MSEYWSMKDIWKDELTDEMFDFIRTEFNITKDEVLTNDTFAFYDKLVDDIFDIEIEEIPDDANEPISERGKIAINIINLITPCQEEDD